MIWGQCLDAMQTRIQEAATYESTRQAKDAIGIVQIIKSISFNYRAHQEPVVAINAVKHDFFKLCQGKYQSVQEFCDDFKNMVKVNKELGAKIGWDKGISDIIAQENNKTSMMDAEKTQYSNKGKERYLAVRMLMASDRNIFGGLIEDLRNDYLTGTNKYPKTMATCFTLLNHWSKNPRNVPGAMAPNNVGMAFTHEGEESDGDVLVNDERNTCTRCGRNNHPTQKCHAKYHHNGTVLFMERTSKKVLIPATMA